MDSEHVVKETTIIVEKKPLALVSSLPWFNILTNYAFQLKN